MTEPYTPPKWPSLTPSEAIWFAEQLAHGPFNDCTNESVAATLRAYASLLTREAKMREALEEIAGRGGDCGRIARRALEETKG
jgi:hypothetical protein